MMLQATTASLHNKCFSYFRICAQARLPGMNTFRWAVCCYILPQRFVLFTPYQQYVKMLFALSPFHCWEIAFKKIFACFGEKQQFLIVDLMCILWLWVKWEIFSQRMPSLCVLFVEMVCYPLNVKVLLIFLADLSKFLLKSSLYRKDIFVCF